MSAATAAPPSPLSMRELVAPATLAALALLALNDGLLKRHWPGAISGKLSDVAICFLLPLYLSALLGLLVPRRPRGRLLAGAALTVLGFTALELYPGAVTAFCRVNDALGPALGLGLGCRMTSDPTDLGALLLVPLAYLYGRRRLTPAGENRGAA
jgi:hypothetical protein